VAATEPILESEALARGSFIVCSMTATSRFAARNKTPIHTRIVRRKITRISHINNRGDGAEVEGRGASLMHGLRT
jgi:hypothetical protein